MHHRSGGENVAGLDHGVEEARLHCATELGVLVLGLAFTVHRQQVDAAAWTVATVASIQLETEHSEGVDTEAYRALRESRFEFADDAVGPCFGVPVAGIARLAVTEVPVHIEIAIEECEAAAFDETFRLLFSRRSHRHGAHDRGHDGE
ncbi:hypothetical protein D3C78_1504350 [compost metagenome]